MSPYFTSAIVGGAIMFALQFVGLGFADDIEDDPLLPASISVANR